jgi:hypothetical protein
MRGWLNVQRRCSSWVPKPRRYDEQNTCGGHVARPGNLRQRREHGYYGQYGFSRQLGFSRYGKD